MAKRLHSSLWGDEIEICREMGWSYSDSQAAPAQMVDEIRVLMAARTQVERERSRRGEKGTR
jgi:hypothetical protein